MEIRSNALLENLSIQILLDGIFLISPLDRYLKSPKHLQKRSGIKKIDFFYVQ